jgi:hypothetical protein
LPSVETVVDQLVEVPDPWLLPGEQRPFEVSEGEKLSENQVLLNFSGSSLTFSDTGLSDAVRKPQGA